MLNKLADKLLGNEFDRLLKKATKQNEKRFLIYWNRGLGDIALGLYALFERIKTSIPGAEITVVTREELAEAFQLLDVGRVLVVPELARSSPWSPTEAFSRLGLNLREFDVVLERANPTKWLPSQIGRVTPRLQWKPEYDALCDKFDLPGGKLFVAAHVNSETGHFYGYVKDWPIAQWQALFTALEASHSVEIVLFGHSRDDAFVSPGVVDLRGQTSLLEMLSVIKNRCQVLIAPDSGILSMTYYLDCFFPLTLVSLWADPRQGVLKQSVASPNQGLRHFPLLGPQEDVSKIEVNEVLSIVVNTLQKAGGGRATP